MLSSSSPCEFPARRCTSLAPLHSCVDETYDSAAPRHRRREFSCRVVSQPPETSLMNREKLAWTLSVVLVAVLAFQIPGSMAARDSDYAWVSTLVDVHRRVADNYVEPVDEEKLRQGAVDGMLEQLDPYTVYVPPAKQEDFDRMLEGSFKGVGIQLEQDPKTLEIEVISPIDGSPAFKAGVMSGDIIMKVNGESIAGLKVDDVVKKIAGPLGSPVKLTVRHVTNEIADLSMTRQEIVIPTIKGYQRKRDTSWDWYVS